MSDERVAALTVGRPAGHTGASSRLLVGWEEIATYARKRPTTLRNYRLKMAFPVVRWGRHVVSSPTLIDDWLLTIEQRRRRRRMALTTDAPPKA
jgi:hypothetical protein